MTQYRNNCSCGMNPSANRNTAYHMNQAAHRPSQCNTNQASNCKTPCHMEPSPKQEPCRPPMSKTQLLKYINEVSFAKDEMLLYLDTHPCDKEALEFCKKHVKMRNEALKEYAKLYGPLTIDTTDDVASKSWEWVMQPWPWEGGAC